MPRAYVQDPALGTTKRQPAKCVSRTDALAGTSMLPAISVPDIAEIRHRRTVTRASIAENADVRQPIHQQTNQEKESAYTWLTQL